MAKSVRVAFTTDWELWRDPKGDYELHDLATDDRIIIEPYDDYDQIEILMRRIKTDIMNQEILEEIKNG